MAISLSIKEIIKNVLGLNRKVYSSKKEYRISVEEKMRFKDKVAIVTGGSGAIGRATAAKLMAEGAIVYIAGRNENRLNSIIEELNDAIKNRGLIKKMVLDVSDSESIENEFDSVIRKEGKVDILINCAGGGARDRAKFLVEQDVDVIDEVLNTNLRGSILCARAVARNMMNNGYGKIVNISSSIGISGLEKCVDYSSAKSGMFGMTKSLAKELGKYNINVNCVTPGSIIRGDYSILEEERQKNTNYLNKVASMEDVANVILFMSSNESDFITGQNIVVDGGRTLGMKIV